MGSNGKALKAESPLASIAVVMAIAASTPSSGPLSARVMAGPPCDCKGYESHGSKLRAEEPVPAHRSEGAEFEQPGVSTPGSPVHRMPSPEGPAGPIQLRPALRGLWKSMDDVPGVETPG